MRGTLHWRLIPVQHDGCFLVVQTEDIYCFPVKPSMHLRVLKGTLWSF